MLENRSLIKEGHPQIFIVGMARSGTTLLSEILNRHSGIAVSPETQYFWKYWLGDKPSSLKKRIKLSEKFLNCDEFRQFGFSIEEKKEIEGEIHERLKSGHTEILSGILTRYRRNRNKPLWAEKTTAHLMYIPEIVGLFPDAKFICITRDPRDICLSLKKVPFNAGSAMSIARRWKRYTRRSLSYRRVYKNIFLEIKYEDLINNPAHELKNICEFLGIDYQGEMLNQNRAPGTFDGKKEFWKLNAINTIDKNNYEKWKKEMKPGEVFFFQKYLSRELRRYQYVIQPIKFDFDIFRQIVRIYSHWCFTVSLNLAHRAIGIGRHD